MPLRGSAAGETAAGTAAPSGVTSTGTDVLNRLRTALAAMLHGERQARGRETQAGIVLSLAHIRALAVIERAAGRRVTAGELAAAADLSTPGVSRLLDTLERRGLIERVRSSTDRRVVFIRLTDGGRLLYEQQSRRYVRCWEQALGDLGEQELLGAIEVLARIERFFSCASQPVNKGAAP